jgi:hypothetical protein
MSALTSKLMTKPLRGIGLNPLFVPLAFTTDGSADPTLVHDYDGAFSIAKTESELEYTITLGSWARTLALTHSVRLVAEDSEEASVEEVDSTFIDDTPADGTIVIRGLPFASVGVRVDLVLCVSTD